VLLPPVYRPHAAENEEDGLGDEATPHRPGSVSNRTSEGQSAEQSHRHHGHGHGHQRRSEPVDEELLKLEKEAHRSKEERLKEQIERIEYQRFPTILVKLSYKKKMPKGPLWINFHK
jgi:hypothetical protein